MSCIFVGDVTQAVRNGGHHAHLQGGPKPPHLCGITVHQIFIHANHDELTELAEPAEAGIISARVAGICPLEDAAVAYKRLAKAASADAWCWCPRPRQEAPA